MKHQDLKKWLPMMIYEELNADERSVLDEHLQECKECRSTLAELRNLNSVLTKHKLIEVDEPFLQSARQQLRGALRVERLKQSVWTEWLKRLRSLFVFPGYKAVFGGLVTLTVGLILGYVIFAPVQRTASLENHAQSDPFSRGNGEITNIRFIDSNTANGEIEFTFDTITPIRVRGNMTDDRIQKVLTRAVATEQNPGVRLRAVNAFNSYPLKASDPQVKTALIKVMQTDGNPGVRKEALKALQRFPFDDDIRNAFLFVLVHDKNSGLRITAINALGTGRGTEEWKPDSEMMRILQEKVQSDDNNYIRLRAKTVLEEMK